METLLLEDDDPGTALLRYVSAAGIQSLVLGSCSSNFVMRYVIILTLSIILYFIKCLYAVNPYG